MQTEQDLLNQLEKIKIKIQNDLEIKKQSELEILKQKEEEIKIQNELEKIKKQSELEIKKQREEEIKIQNELEKIKKQKEEEIEFNRQKVFIIDKIIGYLKIYITNEEISSIINDITNNQKQIIIYKIKINDNVKINKELKSVINNDKEISSFLLNHILNGAGKNQTVSYIMNMDKIREYIHTDITNKEILLLINENNNKKYYFNKSDDDLLIAKKFYNKFAKYHNIKYIDSYNIILDYLNKIQPVNDFQEYCNKNNFNNFNNYIKNYIPKFTI